MPVERAPNASVASTPAPFALAPREVELLYARSITSYKYGQTSQNVVIDILVDNLAPDKRVSVHLQDADGAWVDVAAQYVRPAGEKRELWRATFLRGSWQGKGPLDLRFALEYRVAGVTYWDNDAGQDYRIGADDGALLLGQPVYQSNAEGVANIYADTLHGSVTLQNLGYAKQVTIVYTVDDWQTAREAYAGYTPYFWYGAYSSAANPNDLGAEEWGFNLDVAGGVDVEYAIAYTVSGVTYWDNNWGRNYRTHLIR